MTESKDNGQIDQRIAIVGISAILPGGENINECWEMINAGLDKISELPPDRVDLTAYFNPEKGVKDKIYCKRGGFIPEYDFDAREFGMNMFQVEDADANQTLTLLKVKEAMEDAKIDPFTKKKKNMGVVLGIGGGQKASNEFYSRMNYAVVEKVLQKMNLPQKDIDAAVEKFKSQFPEWRLDSFPGFLGNVTAGRCTNVFNLAGMNCVVDAACASSLIALKVAIDELLHGDCDEMICGSTCTDNSIGMYMAFSKTPVFSTDDSLTAYDENTKGMLIGEGSVMLVLKRYADAVAAGDEIHAVIRGVASSSDGKASGIYSPTVDGQEMAINRAYQKAGVNPGDVTLVEGHGTGTPVGDRIELTGLKNVFTKHYGNEKEQVAVGSIKSQIGHLKSVAGMAGLAKVVMALKHKILPASINVKNPPILFDNTKIQDSPLYVNTQSRPWFTPNGKSRIAGISSFGFGGANYHAVVEEAESEQSKAYRMHDLPQPVVISAANVATLLKVTKSALSNLESKSNFAALHEFRAKFTLKKIEKSEARVGFVSANVDQTLICLKEIAKKLETSSSADSWTLIRQGCVFRSKGLDVDGKVAALFSGQGAQYNNMFSDVAKNWPSFREIVTKMDRKSEKICGLRASAVLYPRKPYEAEPKLDDSIISSVQNAQIATVACSLGAYNIFQQAGFKPDFAAGHSLGEFSALFASGALDSVEDVCEIVANRAKIMSENISGKGAMLAVIGKGASSLKISTPDVWMGNSNGPDQVVLTGTSVAIEKEAEILKSKFKVMKLNVADGYHSKLMQPANAKFVAKMKSLKFNSPSKAKLFCNTTAKICNSSPTKPLEEHMVSSVKFQEQIKNMYNAGARVFVEFGPRHTLVKLVENILKDKSDIFTAAVNSTSKLDSESQLRDCAMRLCVAGVALKNFDPWPLENKFKLNAKPRKKTTLRLSAATYVSKKTLKEREAILNDGRTVSLTSDAATSDSNQLKKELESVKRENKDLERKLKLASHDVSDLKKRLEALENATTTSASVRDDFVEIKAIKKHRDMIVGMLGEYDKMIDTLSNYEERDAQENLAEMKSLENSSAEISSELLDNAEKVVLQVLAEKTGYEVEMIEQDMELETELGIDSIKRVEILSEVQSTLNVEAKDVDALSRTRTVGEVINAIKFEIGAVSINSPQASQKQETEIPESSKTLMNNAEQAVMSVLAEKTGYEVEMIENDMELETELGIDSIKRVEILSEVQALLNIEAQDVDALSRTRTVGEVIDCMKKEIAGFPVKASPTEEKPKSKVSSETVAQASQIVLQVLAEKTGYEVEMIEGDMELETELGIDSIKRVEILSEVQTKLGIEAKDVDALSRTRTVDDVIKAIQSEMGDVPSTTTPSKTVTISSNSDLLKKAEDVVLAVMAEKTGYEVEMIEGDMELETELGIDSIKRVEILSEVQTELGIEAKDVDALSRTRTVAEVISAMKNEISSSTPAKAVVSAQTSAVTSSNLSSKAEETVLSVIAEKTGYEVDMIEEDMELETELGIDSIKRVEILSEVQTLLNIEAKDVDALSRTRTVGEVIAALKKEISGSSSPVDNVPPVVKSTSDNNNVSSSRAEESVLSVIAEKTGYEVDMIEEDMELETELGIDSIKRVEILSEVQTLLNIEAKDVDALSRTRTVGEVIEALKKELGDAPVSSAPVSVPTAVHNNVSASRAEESVLSVIAEKTGYEVDMIEEDMELETELGIDSIKRVEILSEVQTLLNIEAKDVDALSRTRTVGEVIAALKKELQEAPSTASSPSTVTTNSFVVVSDVSSNDVTAAESAVLDVIAEKTGYEVDMIEQDMELETELGIDSIKRVEILSEVQTILNIEAKDVDALSRTRTVGEVIEALKKELGSEATPTKTATSTVDKSALANAEKIVFQVLAEKTGYEVDMIEEDMELETELGIDSIKRVEILSEVQTLLNIEAKDVDALSRTRTVGEVVSALQAELSSSSSQVSSSLPDFNSSVFDSSNYNIRAKGCEKLNLSFPEVVEIQPVAERKTNLKEIVFFGNNNVKSLVRKIENETKSGVTFVSNEGNEENIKAEIAKLGQNISNIVYLKGSEEVGNALMVAKHIKSKLSNKDCQILFVLRGDGNLGYSGDFSSVQSLENYSLCGLAKTIALEWPNVKSKLLDVHTLNNEEILAKSIFSELLDANKLLKEVGIGTNGKRYGVVVKGLTSTIVTKKVSSNDTWIVAGGARGITPLCIKELAKQCGGGKYILVGRSALKDTPSWAKNLEESGNIDEKSVQKAAISVIKSQGQKPKPVEVKKLVGGVIGSLEVRANLKAIGKFCNNQVWYKSCDINDKASVENMISDLKREGHEITGFFHASGVLRDKLIESKDLRDFQLVYNTKVRGFDNIFSCLEQSKLKHAVLFSSLAGFYGNKGQSDYSMANEVLNKICYMLSARGIQAKAFDFGPWDGGMVTPALKKHFLENNVQIIDRSGGAETVAKIMLNSTKKQILVGNWGLLPQKPDNESVTVETSFVETDVLKDHSIKGVAVMPFTFTLSWIVEQVLGFYPGHYLEEVVSCKLFRGIKLQTNAVKCKLDIKNVGGNKILAKLYQQVSGKFVPSFETNLVLSESFVDLNESLIDINVAGGKILSLVEVYDGETLFHGKYFQGIEQVKFSDTEIVAKCDLSKIEGQKAPELLLDLVFQTALVSARKVGGQASLPSTFSSIKTSSKFFDGSRSFRTCFIVMKRLNAATNSTWEYDFTIQDDIVLCQGTAFVTLNANMSYK